ncbi:MAG: calcium-binding protein [Nostoc sp.]
MANIIGTNGNDTLLGTNSADTIKGLAGNDTITAKEGNDTLTGGGGKDKFVYNLGNGIDTIIDFGGVGKGTNPTAAVIAGVDTIKFLGADFTARNLLLTQNGNNLEITFQGVDGTKVILQNFKLENLDNLKASGTKPAIGNILFDGQTSITDNFNVLDANSTDTSLGIKNTVTFLNDLDNNITGLDNSDDVVNGQGGNDKIDGKSGNDLLRGGTGNNTLIGGVGNDILDASYSSGNNILSGDTGDDYLNIKYSTGNNTASGADGNDTLDASYSFGNNIIRGDTGNNYLDISFSTGNNTVSSRDGDNYFYAYEAQGRNTLDGGDGSDRFILSAPDTASSSLATQTVDGRIGFNSLSIYYTKANGGITSTFDPATNSGSITAGTNQVNYKNIGVLDITGTTYDDYIVGSNGDDLLFADNSGDFTNYSNDTIFGGAGDDYLNAGSSTGNNILNGGAGYDTLIAGSTGNNLLSGGDGNDNLSVSGSSSNNTLNGGAGDDTLSVASSKGDNLVNGGDGNDSLSNFAQSFNYFTSGNNTLNGGAGNDTLDAVYSTGNNILNGGDGNDFLSATGYNENYTVTVFGNNILNGGDGNDSFTLVLYPSPSSLATQTVDGGTGNDLLNVSSIDPAGAVTSTFDAATNTGSITVDTNLINYKNIEQLVISGTGYDDLITGSNGNDTLSVGYGGNDTVDGGTGDDLLSVSYYDPSEGSAITSTFNAATSVGSITVGTNRVSYKNIERLDISGTAYNDYILGSNGNDTLKGGDSGNDTLKGGNGNDYLIGGNGNDALYGGSGIDTFAFSSFNEGVNRLYDFNATNELIQISAAGFGGGLSIGSLSASEFTLGSSATNSTQRFIYNNITGALFFDQDGSASAFTQVQFAQVLSGSSLTKNNFVVV